MNGSSCYAPGTRGVCTLLLLSVFALVACSTPPVPQIRAQGPQMVELDDLRVLVRPRKGLMVQVTWLEDADPPGWEIAWPANAPLSRLQFASDDGEPLLRLVDMQEEGEFKRLHQFAVKEPPRGRSLGIDLVTRLDGGYSISQVMAGVAPLDSASFGAVETLSTVRVPGP